VKILLVSVKVPKSPLSNGEVDSISLALDANMFSRIFPFLIGRTRCNREVKNAKARNNDRFSCRREGSKDRNKIGLNQKRKCRIEYKNVEVALELYQMRRRRREQDAGTRSLSDRVQHSTAATDADGKCGRPAI
jgi:hypothetical protein